MCTITNKRDYIHAPRKVVWPSCGFFVFHPFVKTFQGDAMFYKFLVLITLLSVRFPLRFYSGIELLSYKIVLGGMTGLSSVLHIAFPFEMDRVSNVWARR